MVSPAPPEDVLDLPGDPESVARAICLRALTQRARTRTELAGLLSRRGVPAEAAAHVLDRFTEVGLIDDVALAENFVAGAHLERGLSRRAVAAKLRDRGVDEQIVEAAVIRIDAESEYAAARTIAARRLRSLGGLEPRVQARRVISALARRGYPPALAVRVVNDLIGELAGSDSAPTSL